MEKNAPKTNRLKSDLAPPALSSGFICVVFSNCQKPAVKFELYKVLQYKYNGGGGDVLLLAQSERDGLSHAASGLFPPSSSVFPLFSPGLIPSASSALCHTDGCNWFLTASSFYRGTCSVIFLSVDQSWTAP